MRSIRILDCTLRDGGFSNDWNFGVGSIKSIISRLDKAGIDIIEVGFIDERQSYDQNRSIVPDTDSIKPLFRNVDIKNSMIVGMIDFGTCPLERISDRADSCLDGIRVIFKKKDQDQAIQFCRDIKEKGYKVFVQPVSITGYSDDEIVALMKKIDAVGFYAVSIVDTYGLMHRSDLLHYFNIFDTHLNRSISIGYHSHNNFQLAYANSLELSRVEAERDLVLDSSLYGMGKGAGNSNTELIAAFCNENFGKKYDIEQLLEHFVVQVLVFARAKLVARHIKL